VKVPIEITLNQVRDGYEYDGECRIADKPFAFRISFPMGIERFCNLGADEMPDTPSRIMEFVPMAVTSNGQAIVLGEKPYGLFLALVGPVAIDFFRDPQTRDSNDGMLGDMLRGGPLLNSIASAKIGMSTRSTYDIADDVLQDIGCEL
jgi:hypothetical protein